MLASLVAIAFNSFRLTLPTPTAKMSIPLAASLSETCLTMVGPA